MRAPCRFLTAPEGSPATLLSLNAPDAEES